MQWLIIGFCSLRKVDMSLLSLSSSTLFFKSKTSVNKTTIRPIRTSFSVTFPSLLSALLPNLIRALLIKALYIIPLVSYLYFQIWFFFETCFHFQNVKGFVSVVFPFSEKHNCKSVKSLQKASLTRKYI